MNLFSGEIPSKDESFTTLLEHKNIKIVHIISSAHLESHQYCQNEDEWVVVIEGEATLIVDNKRETLSKGESLFIPALSPHTIESVQKGTIWLALHIY